jgi:hypothetical protein
MLLAALDAPFWTFYVAPIVMAPFMIQEFRDQETAEVRKRPERRRSRARGRS